MYPESVALDALPAASSLHGACDEATLAAACTRRLGTAEPPQACLDAYAQAVTTNPAFAFADGLGRYVGKLVLVAPPPITRHALVGLTLDYKWSGTGTEWAWTVKVSHATTAPRVTVTGASAKAGVDIRDKIEAFASNSYPEWMITLELDGGGKLELANHRSNLIPIGGPFQMTIDGVTYMQVGTQLTRAVGDLVEARGLPLSAPQDTTCTHYDLESAVLK